VLVGEAQAHELALRVGAIPDPAVVLELVLERHKGEEVRLRDPRGRRVDVGDRVLGDPALLSELVPAGGVGGAAVPVHDVPVVGFVEVRVEVEVPGLGIEVLEAEVVAELVGPGGPV
jgi:hypothetical protein